MIQIKNLTKIYEVKNQEGTLALDNVSFDLPDKGLVFVVGKSGSGKTTFLNLLGGLDNISSGNIIADGLSFNEMTIEDYQKYRASYLGFVFQDFCLIDSLSVFDNIKISLDINNINDEQLVDDVLEKVDLKNRSNRFPNQLSAGQKQRVAIARAVVKSPKLILCDEPTGNLDSKTSKQILCLLKELSKDRLIVIVSHNMDDAYTYGDRIIELSDGHVILDAQYESSQDSNLFDNETLYLGNVNEMNESDIVLINKKLSEGQLKEIKPKKELLVCSNGPSVEEKSELNNVELIKNAYPFNKSKKLSFAFLKRRLGGSIISSFFAALVVMIFGLCQMFTMFDSKAIVKSTLSTNDQPALVMKKAMYNPEDDGALYSGLNHRLTEDDYQLAKTSGYKGNIYSLYNYSLPISFSMWNLQSEVAVNDKNNYREFYAQEIYGVLVCDESFVKNVFNYHGNISYSALAEEQKDYGIYITDYIADSILYHRDDKYETYEDILGEYKNDNVFAKTTYAYINGIINTGYQKEYSSLMKEFETYVETKDYSKFKEILNSDDFLKFYEIGKNYLSVAYSFNENFVELAKSPEVRNVARFDFSRVTVPRTDFEHEFTTAYGFYDDSLPKKTISVYYQTLVTLLDIQPENEDDEITFDYVKKLVNEMKFTGLLLNNFPVLSKYDYYDFSHPEDSTPIFELTINVEVHDDKNRNYKLSSDMFSLFRDNDIFAYAMYFDDLGTAQLAYDALVDIPFVASNSYVSAAISVSDVVKVFSDFYALISALLCAASLFVIVSYAFNTVNSRKKEIGILKALGTSNKDLAKIFIFQIILIGLLTCAIYVAGLFALMKLANVILVNSFMSFMNNPALKSVSIISFHASAFLLDLAIILVATVVAAIIPILLTRKIKPLNIIKSKD